MKDLIKTDVVIIGAGPVGLFTVFELGILGIKCHVVDNLDKIGGQCIELYPDKPIYDIPGLPNCTGRSLIKNLLEQIKPFSAVYHLNQRVESLKESNNSWLIKTSKGSDFLTKNVIIAGGVGSFEPRKLSIDESEKYVGKGLDYQVNDKNLFKNKKVVVFGGGDSALDWALELVNIAQNVTLVHRRSEFKAANHSVSSLMKLADTGRIKLKIPYKISDIEGEKKVEKILIKNIETGESEKIEVDNILAFFGLKMELGPINDWGLDFHEKRITVNTKNFQTNHKGIFAIGDICYYPGKLELILSGFHEGTLAAKACFKRAYPDKKLIFKQTTSSKEIHKLLGV